MNKSLLETALHYRQKFGWNVFPSVGNKKPVFKWKNLQTEPVTDEQINKWWAANPDYNITVVTGSISQIVVLDIDGIEGEQEIERRGELPLTVCSESREHHQLLYFQHPGFPCPNFAKKIPAINEELPGLDLRGDGGFVLAPPSKHHSGSTYQWINSPDDTPIAPLPDWLLDLLLRAHQAKLVSESNAQANTQAAYEYSVGAHLNGNAAYVKSAIDKELQILSQSTKGSRNEQLNKSAFSLGQFVGAGAIARSDIETELERVALSIGMKQNEDGIRETIKSGLDSGIAKPRKIPEAKHQKTPRLSTPDRVLRGKQARAFIDGASEDEASEVDPEGDETDPTDWRTGPYGISDGRLVYIFEKSVKGETTSVTSTIANLTAYISREITTEHGERFFVIKGQNIRGRKFEFEISSEEFSDDRKLKAALIAAAGAKSTVMAGMAKHLYPAVDILTGTIEQSTRYDRVGWAKTPNGDVFLLPGREDRLPEYSTIHIQGGLPYEFREGAELEKGLEGLRHLLKAQSTPLLCVELAAMLQAPLSYMAGWRNERYATFITGRTNSFKTETMKVLCTLYGPDFLDDRHLLRWDGTSNAIMKMATLAYDMPLMIDNYKPNVGKDAAGKCISLIQSIVEGSEKARMNRDRTLADRDAIYAMPFFTGEDVPDSDAASLSRVLILRFPQWSEINEELTAAQGLSHHFCAVSAALFDWLETAEGKEVAKSIGQQYLDRRGSWSSTLRSIRLDMQGVPRIATNLATNELAWAILMECPALKGLMEEFYTEHQKGLRMVARDMSNQTAESLEAHRYLEALRQLIAVERYALIERHHSIPIEKQEKVIGWIDDKGVYLMPDLAYRVACDLLRDSGGLSGMTKSTLHKQLDSLGLLANKGSGGSTINQRCGGNVQRVLHLTPEALELKMEDESEKPATA